MLIENMLDLFRNMGLNYQVKLWIIKGVFYMQLEMQFYCSEIVALLVVGGRLDFILTYLSIIKMHRKCQTLGISVMCLEIRTSQILFSTVYNLKINCLFMQCLYTFVKTFLLNLKHKPTSSFMCLPN